MIRRKRLDPPAEVHDCLKAFEPSTPCLNRGLGDRDTEGIVQLPHQTALLVDCVAVRPC